MSIILGIDEVGRGPWAGPLVVGAAILGVDFAAKIPELWDLLTDSKKLTAKKRQELAPLIEQHAPATATGWVSSSELDRYGLSASLKLATRRAVKQILATGIKFDEIIIDGTSNFLSTTPLSSRVTVLKKADLLIKEVSAASIVAKVARDRYMIELEAKYPGYGFDKHMGYGTAFHKGALLKLGVCPEHRTSFRPIRELLENRTLERDRRAPNSNCHTPIPDYRTPSKNDIFTGVDSSAKNRTPTNLQRTPSSTTLGQLAEASVATHLESLGHHIIAKNYKTKTYEIDLISTLDSKIYFTEVKYSKNTRHTGTPLTRITKAKFSQMTYAANKFLASHPEYRKYSPALAAASVLGPGFTVEDWFPISA